MRNTLLVIAALTCASHRVRSQTMTMRASAGEVMAVAPGQLLVVNGAGDRVTVEGVVVDVASTVDVRQGDRIVRFQGAEVRSLAALIAAYRAVAAGTPLTLGIRRGAIAHEVRFTKPAASAGPTMAVQGGGGASGAGAWTRSDGAAEGFTILGAELKENNEGLPEVVNRTAHALASSLPLRVGDVAIEMNGRPIAALAGLQKWYAEATQGQSITLKIRRGAATHSFTFAKPAS